MSVDGGADWSRRTCTDPRSPGGVKADVVAATRRDVAEQGPTEVFAFFVAATLPAGLSSETWAPAGRPVA